jgi:superfamily II RNA helicase
MGCQILVTVPHILQIMLLAPSNANAWTPRIKRIIFDEIHCIGQADDGLVWEQLLLLAPCPIIALSATVGNPREFYNWLHLAQGTNGFDLKIVQHKHRYSELRKYVYHPPQNFLFKGFAQHGKLPRLGLDALEDMEFVHPATSLLDRSRGIPEDLDLEPRDCLTLWRAMRDVQTKDFPVQSSLDPTLIFLDTIIQKKHIIEWQTKLKDLLEEWMKDRDSPFELVLRQLDHIENQPSYLGVKTQSKVSDLHALSIREGSEVLDTTLPLISSLHSQGALPALFFNYDRALCEDICYTLLTQLKSSENVWKKESSVWKRDFEQWNQWKLSREQADRKDTKSKKKKSNGDEQSSRAEQMRDSASVERSQFESFDPEKPVDGFHLANYKMLPSEFPAYIRELRRREVQEWLIEALERGIGVHHAGMNRKYRYVCEILFRRGFLRVVIATGTLALGINMPCKTVVFSGDSIFLTALNFRQAAGRAGRRGFDMLGNVVFQHVPTSKMKRLISSRLPDLNGHFPITTSLVLRLFILLEGSNGSVSAVRSINSLLSTPRIYLGGPEMKETVLHHLRFSIEYLRRNNLLGSTGQPLDFAGVISHLYHTETASFAFHALLRAGYFFTLCENIKTNPKTTMRTLMLVMSHLFGRQSVRLSTLESYWSAEKRPSSKVVLPPLPKKAASVLSSHNEQVLSIYTGYVQSFINQHVKEEDCFLPFSGIKCGGDYSAETLGLSNSNRNSTMVTSPFFALSGHGDRWDTIADLCEMIRSGVWLEESVIPYLCASEQEDVIPLNAYLLDFFKHGSIRQLETANHIRRGDIWFVLNDFSLILATINTTLRNFLDPRGSIDADMLNVVGGGDAHDISVDNQFVDEENPETKKTGTRRPDQIESEEIQIPLPVFKSSAKDTLENWEDEMAEDSEDSKFKHRSSQSTKKAVNSKFQQKVTSDKSMALVARGFQMLQDEFDRKFKAMWA